MKKAIILLIRFYQRYISKHLNRECIYVPTCSNYAIISIQKYGLTKGVYYFYKRLKICNGALYKGGEDYP